MTTIMPKGVAETAKANTTGIRSDVLQGLQNASAKTGVDFNYLLAQAKIESGLDPNAKAPTSSASGLFQFIQSTWLAEMKEHGVENGVDPKLIDQIKIDSSGQATVSDPAARKQLLDLRNDPRLASVLGAEYAADNKVYLEGQLGRRVNGADLYMAHFLGAGGASKFLSALASKPGASAADLFPDAADANHNVFYGKDGRELSVSEVYNKFANKISDAGDTVVTAVATEAVQAGHAIVAMGSRLASGVVNTATSIANKFMPTLSPETVLTLASLPMPARDGSGNASNIVTRLAQTQGSYAYGAANGNNSDKRARKDDDDIGSTAWALARTAAANPIAVGF